MVFGKKKAEQNGSVETVSESKSGKSSLFGSRSKGQPSAQATNPYANPPPAQDPYAARPAIGNPYATSSSKGNPYATGPARHDPYARSNSSQTQPPTNSFGNLSLNSTQSVPPPYNASPADARRYEKSPAGQDPSPRYQAQPGATYGAGYGGDKYGSSAQPRTNGYGGLNRTASQDTMSTDAGRSALFGAAPQRVQQQAQDSAKAGGLPPQSQDNSYSNATNYASDDMPGGYGYERPPQTEEEIEEQEIKATKDQIRQVRQETNSSAANARRIAEQTEALGRETLARLAGQGERLHNTEKNLDLSHHQNVLAKGKAGELKTLNRSMFAVHVDNPFTKEKRERAMLEIASEKRREERELQGDTQASKYQSQARMQNYERGLNNTKPAPRALPDYAKRSRFMFEPESDEDEVENQIDENLDAIHRSARTMNQLSQAMGQELDKQNEHISRVAKKTDKVDDEIARNRALLDRF